MSRWGRTAVAALALLVALVAMPSVAMAAQTVQGIVTNTTASPLAGINVVVEGVTLGYPYLAQATTGPNGAYTFGVPAGGDYIVRADDPSAAYLADRRYLTNVATGTVVTANFTLLHPGGISGTARDAMTSSPIQHIEVQSVRLAGDFEFWDGTALTDQYGRYSISGANPGPHAVYFRDDGNRAIPYAPQWYSGAATMASATTVTVTELMITPNVDAALSSDTVLGGRVTDASNGMTLGSTIITVQNIATADQVWTSTSADGTYHVAGLPAGNYEVWARSSATPPDYTGPALFPTLVAHQVLTNVDFAMTPAAVGYLTGRAVDAAAVPAGGIEVSLAMGVPTAHNPIRFSTVTAANGTFSLPPRAGMITLRFFDPTGAHPSFVATSVPAGTGALGDFVLTRTGRISGTTVDASGTPIAGIFVRLWDATNLVAPLDSATTGLNGSYSFGELPAGNYRIGFSADGYQSQYYNRAITLQSATNLPVSAGSLVTANAVLVRSLGANSTALSSAWVGSGSTLISPAYGATVRIAGRLVAGDGNAMQGAVVNVQKRIGTAPWATVATTTADSTGLHSHGVSATTRTEYRLSFAGDAVYGASVSRALVLYPKTRLTINPLRSSYRRFERFTVSGAIAPSHTANSSKVVQVRLYRLRNHKWVSYTTMWAKLGSSGSTYSVRVSLPTTEKWRIVPLTGADSQHASTLGPSRYTVGRR